MQQLDPKAVWLFFINLISRWFFFIFILALYGSFTMRTFQNGMFLLDLILPLLILAPILLIVFLWIWAKLSYRFYRYELREDGFRKELGVIWKKYVTIPYDRIQNVDIYRGVVARILGLSDLNIQTAGASAQALSEGRLPGLSREVAEQIRDELIRRARQSRTTNQGL